MKTISYAIVAFVIILTNTAFLSAAASNNEPPLSEATEACLGCHESVTPGIVGDWKNSTHSHVTVSEALKKTKLEKRVSIDKISPDLAKTVVGCAECHTANPDKHKDTFEHNGYSIHVVVSPQDCQTCHPVEVEEYSQNIMSQAVGNLKNNALYGMLVESIVGTQKFDGTRTFITPPNDETLADACYQCHGTEVKVDGMKERETAMGAMSFPVLIGWPNQGVGRVNPDGSIGACTSCHPRHEFSIETARKPYTCSQCHKGPDVPAYKVYEVSKHGNIFSSEGKSWNFKAVPWVVGRDFTAPTCATCHASLIADDQGNVIAERTHRMNDRLPYRLFGLIYAHPHPISPDTTIIKNKMGLPLPTELTGEPVSEFLIDAAEMDKRKAAMKNVCGACHASGWVDGHFRRMENTIAVTNEMTLAATKILLKAWDKGLAGGPSQNDSPFNEKIEKMWIEQWLFYANSTRFSSAMMGADYGVFADGRWAMSKNIQEMLDWVNTAPKKRK